MLGIEPMALYMLGKHFPTEPRKRLIKGPAWAMHSRLGLLAMCHGSEARNMRRKRTH